MLLSQAPQNMSYQAVIRDVGGNLITNSTVGVQISILQGSSGGTAVFVETHSALTNANGLLSITIGNGTLVSGMFNAINWASGPYFLKTETDPSGGTNYTISGTSQLLSVPYALYAATGGTPGPTGPPGINGLNGNDGISVDSVYVLNDSLRIKYSTGQTINAGHVRGSQGPGGTDLNTAFTYSGGTFFLTDAGGTLSASMNADYYNKANCDSKFISIPAGSLNGQTLHYNGGSWTNSSMISNTGTAIGINNLSPNSSAILDINSNTKGFLPPRMSTVDRDAISVGAGTAGMVIYNTTEQCLNMHNGTAWINLCNNSSGGNGTSLATAGKSCKTILQNYPTSPDGVYWIDPDLTGSANPIQCYCNMTYNGGGWTLVANNAPGGTGITANWNSSTGSGMTGSAGLANDQLAGLSNWMNLGNTLLITGGASAGTITYAASYNFTLNPYSNYAISLNAENIISGGQSPALYQNQNSMQWTCSDADHDPNGGSNCSVTNNSTPFWYEGTCLRGLWGNAATSYATFWNATVGNLNWGAIWIR
jgi:hypothetical protein